MAKRARKRRATSRSPRRSTPKWKAKLLHVAKYVGIVGGAVSVTFAVLLQFPKIREMVAPWSPTLVWWVESHVADQVGPISATNRATAMAVERLNIITLRDQIATAEKDPALSASPLARERLAELRNELTEAETRQAALRASMGRATATGR